MSINTGEIPLDEISIEAAGCEISDIKTEGSFIIKPRRRGNAEVKAYRHLGEDSTLLWQGTFLVKPSIRKLKLELNL
jgi:hypothetical protein